MHVSAIPQSIRDANFPVEQTTARPRISVTYEDALKKNRIEAVPCAPPRVRGGAGGGTCPYTIISVKKPELG
jgi:hypothetical protein